MVQQMEEFADATKTLSQLASLKADTDNTYVALALKKLANDVGNKPGPVLNGDRTVIDARVDAWLAICRLTEEQRQPAGANIQQLWIDALDAAKAWQHSCE